MARAEAAVEAARAEAARLAAQCDKADADNGKLRADVASLNREVRAAAGGKHVPNDDVTDQGGVEAGASHGLPQHRGQKVVRGAVRQSSAPRLADWRPEGRDDDHVVARAGARGSSARSRGRREGADRGGGEQLPSKDLHAALG